MTHLDEIGNSKAKNNNTAGAQNKTLSYQTDSVNQDCYNYCDQS